MLAWIKWNLDPVLIHIYGSIEIRYYGLVFVCTLIAGFLLWRWQMRRGGFPKLIIENFIVWGTIATILGARLGHVIFYEILPALWEGKPNFYLQHPLHILFFWEGGLASHGAAIGLVLALLLYAKVYKLPYLEILDRFAPAAAVGSAGIRFGNFLNSEIVGRVTHVPWAVIFVRYDNQPRHPSQLYEFAMGMLVLLILVIADRLAGKEKRPRGLLVGLFLLLYFTGRFIVEFFKEYQVPGHTWLTMGQWLSIIPMAIGAILLVWCFIRRVPTRAKGQPLPQAVMPAPTNNSNGNGNGTSKSRKRRRRPR